MKDSLLSTARIKDIFSCFLFIPSLFFTENEIQLIQQYILLQTKAEDRDKNNSWLYLSSIIYVDETHWTLWVNNQIIHSTDSHINGGFQIEKVTPLKAEFSWLPLQSTTPTRFTLRSGQMFLGKENRVIPILKN